MTLNLDEENKRLNVISEEINQMIEELNAKTIIALSLDEGNKRLNEISEQINQLIEDVNSKTTDLRVVLHSKIDKKDPEVSFLPATKEHILTMPNKIRLSLGFSMKPKD